MNKNSLHAKMLEKIYEIDVGWWLLTILLSKFDPQYPIGNYLWTELLRNDVKSSSTNINQITDKLNCLQSIAPSPWANFLTVGLKILTAILGGGAGGGDGIDKVDNGSPMQVSYNC